MDGSRLYLVFPSSLMEVPLLLSLLLLGFHSDVWEGHQLWHQSLALTSSVPLRFCICNMVTVIATWQGVVRIRDN